MSGDIFISYRRGDEAKARLLHGLLRERGVEAWFDAQIGAGADWRAAITQALQDAPVFVLLYSSAAAASPEIAKELAAATQTAKHIVPVRIEDVQPTGSFLYELAGRNWIDAFTDARFADVADRLTELVRGGADAKFSPPITTAGPARAAHQASICVLPFANMSGDVEQEYFSDGISEDIITDLSKVSAIWVTARNTAFQYKGQHVDVPQLARQLEVSHVLEGSVRKAGNRVRITAQLIDASGGHLWAERYDRDLDDIFALQDEISAAIVGALKVKLAPEEKRAIEMRGTSSPEAYRFYLLARQLNASISQSERVLEAIIAFCRRALAIDPDYALAWALLGRTQGVLQAKGDNAADPTEAIEKALSLDPNLAEAHAAKAARLVQMRRFDEAELSIATALRLAPNHDEVAHVRALLFHRQGRWSEAAESFERAAALDDTKVQPLLMLVSVYSALEQPDNVREAARRLVQRAEKVLSQDFQNVSAMQAIALGSASLGDRDRTTEWIDRSLTMDPGNLTLRYNFACVYVQSFNDMEAALDLLEVIFERDGGYIISWMESDPDLTELREHPRFIAGLAGAQARLAQTRTAGPEGPAAAVQ